MNLSDIPTVEVHPAQGRDALGAKRVSFDQVLDAVLLSGPQAHRLEADISGGVELGDTCLEHGAINVVIFRVVDDVSLEGYV
jgi:hypothetical protein